MADDSHNNGATHLNGVANGHAHGVNGHPAHPHGVGLITPSRVAAADEDGNLPATGEAVRSGGRHKYLGSVIKIMLTWPESVVRQVMEDVTQPAGARLAASQVLLAMKAYDPAVDRVFDRAEGKIGPNIELAQNSMTVNAGKRTISAEEIKAAYDKVAKTKGLK